MGIIRKAVFGVAAALGVTAAVSGNDTENCDIENGVGHHTLEDGSVQIISSPIENNGGLWVDNGAGDFSKICDLAKPGAETVEPTISPQDLEAFQADEDRISEVESLLVEAEGYSEDQWAEIEENGTSPYDTIQAFVTQAGFQFFDQSGDVVEKPIAFVLSDAMTSATLGTPDHPDVEGAVVASASVIAVYETDTGSLGVNRIPAHELPVRKLPSRDM